MPTTIIEPFHWVAKLIDGTSVHMTDDRNGHSTSTATPNPELVSVIQLYPTAPGQHMIEVRINLNRGERFVRFWRQFVVPSAGEQLRMNVIGIQALDKTEYRLYVFPNGDTIMSSGDLYHELLAKEN